MIASALGVMTMRSCHSSPASSPANPVTAAHNAVAGVCDNQSAVDAAGNPDETVPPATLPPDLAARLGKADPAVAAIMGQAAGCPSPTTTAP